VIRLETKTDDPTPKKLRQQGGNGLEAKRKGDKNFGKKMKKRKLWKNEGRVRRSKSCGGQRGRATTKIKQAEASAIKRSG